MAERIALWALYLFTAAAVVGFAIFGRHPDLLMRLPNAVPVYARAFTFFPRAHVFLAFAVLALVLTKHARLRWLPAFAACYALSLVSELLGTTLGLPFGPYHYTGGLGIKWLGHVPALIPLSWFFMALPSWILARRLTRASLWRRPLGRALGILSGSLVLLAWDLALDPAMSFTTKYWVWGSSGPYYGMPLLNLAGWYVTGTALMATLSTLSVDEWSADIPSSWLLGFYGANLFLPLGMIAAAGLWPAVLVSLLGVGGSLLVPQLWVRPAGGVPAYSIGVRVPARAPAARRETA